MAVSDLNKVLYVDQDFSTAVANIRDFINTYYPDEFNDYVNTNMGQALIDIIGYAEQNLMWYLNRKVTDLYFPTAKTPNSISKLARALGYKAKTATAAEVPVTITLKKGPYTFPVTINKGFKFKGPNNTVWEYRGNVPIVYAPGELTKTLTLSQGQTVVNTFVSNGKNNQTFILRSVTAGKFAAGSPFTVKVAGVEWTQYPVLPFEGINAYETNLVAFPPTMRFGDSIQGNVPPTGAGIEVSYVVCDGFRGRIISGAITEPVTPLTSNFQSIPITINQAEKSVGGDDPEDNRSIVVNAPLFQVTQDRAITKGDYDFLANQYANVAKADAQIIRGVSGDVLVQSLFSDFRQVIALLERSTCIVSGDISGQTYAVSSLAQSVSGSLDILYEHIDNNFTDSCKGNLVQVSVLGKDSGRRYVSPLQSTLDGLKDYLEQRKEVTHTLSVVSGTDKVVNADISIQVKISKNAIEDDVVKSIEDALNKTDVQPFGLLVERPFNLSLYLSDLYAQINFLQVSGQVVFINIEITGPSEFLDSKGNLIIPDGYVIQTGTITIKRLPRF